MYDGYGGLAPNYVDAVKGFEGWAPKASWDYKQFTNGYGTRAQYPGEAIDKATGEQRLNESLGNAASLVDKYAPNIPEGPRAALTSLTFNSGTNWMHSGLGDAVRQGDWGTAKDHFLQYVNAGGQPLPALQKRRAAEAAWFDQSPDAPMASAFADTRTAQMNPMQAAMQPTGNDANQFAYAPNYDPNAGLFDRVKAGGPGALFGAPGGVFPGKDGRPGYDLGNRLQRAGMFALAASNPSVLGALGQTQPDRKFVQIGTDDLGNPRYGWVDPKSGSVVPTSGTGGGAASGGAGGSMGDSVTAALKSGTTGEELLNQPGISPVIASLVRSISGGAEPYSPSQLMRTPRGTAAMALLKQYEPNATEADFMGRQAGMKDWATKSGDIVRRANQAALHSGELVDSFKAVNNTDYPAINAVKNFVTEQTGGGAPGAARTNVTALANELGAMVRGNGGSDASFKEWSDAFPVNGSPEQQRAAMAKVTSLFEDSMSALEEKRRQAVGPVQAAKLGPLMPKNVRAALDKAKAYSTGGQLPAGVTSIKQISP